jgi:hypothetical protein
VLVACAMAVAVFFPVRRSPAKFTCRLLTHIPPAAPGHRTVQRAVACSPAPRQLRTAPQRPAAGPCTRQRSPARHLLVRPGRVATTACPWEGRSCAPVTPLPWSCSCLAARGRLGLGTGRAGHLRRGCLALLW